MSFDKETSRRLALIELILEVAKRVEGRTRFQKMAYFVNLYNWNCIDDFKFHFFGPFSQTLSDELESMRGNGWIEEESEMTYSDRTLYKYKIPFSKRRIADALIARIDNPELVKRTIPLIRKLDEFTSEELEITSSLIFLKKSYPKATNQELIEMTNNLKPRFNPSVIRDAASKIHSLRSFGFEF